MPNTIRIRLLKGMLDTIVMNMLHFKPIHGYKIITAIRKRYKVYIGPSTIYPLMQNLEDQGLVKSEWKFPVRAHGLGNVKTDRPRRVYSLTEEGKKRLTKGEAELKMIVQQFLAVPV